MNRVALVRAMTVITAAVAVGAPPPAAAATEKPGPAPVVLVAARVFTATSERPLAPGMVIVEGGRIAQVGAHLAIPPGAEVIDLGDATLLPGLIDAHVHLASEMSDN